MAKEEIATNVLAWIHNNLGYSNANGHHELSSKDVETLIKGKEEFWKSILGASPRINSVLAFRASEVRASMKSELNVDNGTENLEKTEKISFMRKFADLIHRSKSITNEISQLQQDIICARSKQVEKNGICDKQRMKLMTLKCYKAKIENSISIMKEYIRRINAAVELHNANRGEGEILTDLSTSVTSKRIAAFCEAVVLNSDAQPESNEFPNIFLHPINLEEFKGLKISKPRLTNCLICMTNQSLESLSKIDFSNDIFNEPKASLASLNQLMLAEQMSHISAFEKVETLRHQAASVHAQVQKRTLELEALHQQVCTDDGERRLRSLVWQQDRDLAAARAAVSSGLAAAGTLRAAVAAQCEPWASLREECTRLHGRAAEREEALARFAALVARNAVTKRRLRRKAALLAAVATRRRDGESDGAQAAADGLRQALLAESRLLRSADPAAVLGALTASSRPVPGLLSCRAGPSDPLLTGVTDALGIPRSLGRDGLVAAAAAASTRWADAAARAEWAARQLRETEADPRRAAWCGQDAMLAARAAVEKLDQVSSCDWGHTEAGCPAGSATDALTRAGRQVWRPAQRAQVDQSLANARDAAAQCARIRALVDDLRDAPGPRAAGWHRVGGRELGEWLGEWRQLTALLHHREWGSAVAPASADP